MVIFEKPLRRACAPPREFPRVPRGCKITEFQSLEKFVAAAKRLKFQVARGYLPSKSGTEWNQRFRLDRPYRFIRKNSSIDQYSNLTGALIRARHERRLRRSCVCQSSEFQGQFGKWGISASSVNPKSRCQTKSPLPDAQLQFYTRINPSLPLLLPLSLCLIQFGFIRDADIVPPSQLPARDSLVASQFLSR